MFKHAQSTVLKGLHLSDHLNFKHTMRQALFFSAFYREMDTWRVLGNLPKIRGVSVI